MISPDRLTMCMKALSMVLFRVFAPILIMMTISSSLWAGVELSRALPDGKLPDDRRLEPLRTLDSHFPFAPVDLREAWQRRTPTAAGPQS